MKPWHQVVTPRKDLREGRPIDASEFAIHLQHVVGGTAPSSGGACSRIWAPTPTGGQWCVPL